MPTVLPEGSRQSLLIERKAPIYVGDMDAIWIGEAPRFKADGAGKALIKLNDLARSCPSPRDAKAVVPLFGNRCWEVFLAKARNAPSGSVVLADLVFLASTFALDIPIAVVILADDELGVFIHHILHCVV